MINTLEDLKRLVGVSGDLLDLDDTVVLSIGMTAWALWLTSTASEAGTDLEAWASPADLAAIPKPPRLYHAEALLVKARIVQEFGFQESLDPEEVSVGGNGTGQKIRMKKLTPAERGGVASELRERARQMLSGRATTDFGGVL